MGVFWITTGITGRGRRENGSLSYWHFLFEVPNMESVEEFCAVVNAGKLVFGSILETVDDGKGGKLIRERLPAAVGAAQVGLVQLPKWRIWEPEESA